MGQQRLITWKHRIWECESKLKTRVPLHCHWGSRSNAEAWKSESGGNTVCPAHRHISASGGRYNWKTKAQGEKQKRGVFLWKNNSSFTSSNLSAFTRPWGRLNGATVKRAKTRKQTTRVKMSKDLPKHLRGDTHRWQMSTHVVPCTVWHYKSASNEASLQTQQNN